MLQLAPRRLGRLDKKKINKSEPLDLEPSLSLETPVSLAVKRGPRRRLPLESQKALPSGGKESRKDESDALEKLEDIFGSKGWDQVVEVAGEWKEKMVGLEKQIGENDATASAFAPLLELFDVQLTSLSIKYPSDQRPLLPNRQPPGSSLRT